MIFEAFNIENIKKKLSSFKAIDKNNILQKRTNGKLWKFLAKDILTPFAPNYNPTLKTIYTNNQNNGLKTEENQIEKPNDDTDEVFKDRDGHKYQSECRSSKLPTVISIWDPKRPRKVTIKDNSLSINSFSDRETSNKRKLSQSSLTKRKRNIMTRILKKGKRNNGTGSLNSSEINYLSSLDRFLLVLKGNIRRKSCEGKSCGMKSQKEKKFENIPTLIEQHLLQEELDQLEGKPKSRLPSAKIRTYLYLRNSLLASRRSKDLINERRETEFGFLTATNLLVKNSSGIKSCRNSQLNISPVNFQRGTENEKANIRKTKVRKEVSTNYMVNKSYSLKIREKLKKPFLPSKNYSQLREFLSSNESLRMKTEPSTETKSFRIKKKSVNEKIIENNTSRSSLMTSISLYKSAQKEIGKKNWKFLTLKKKNN